MTTIKIQSPNLEPFYLQQDEHQFIVCEDYVVEEKNPQGRYNKHAGETRTKEYGYFSKLSSAMEKAYKLRMIRDGDTSLEKYVNGLHKLIDAFYEKSIRLDLEEIIKQK